MSLVYAVYHRILGLCCVLIYCSSQLSKLRLHEIHERYDVWCVRFPPNSEIVL